MHQSSKATAARPSVILLEDYDALAVAIRSALKKFAPDRGVGIARTLTEAETLANKGDPDLFIVDFDPSFPGLTAFFQKMRKGHPDARALVLSGGVPVDIVNDRRTHGALQFIEKPYEVADFGASVQALLGSWNTSETARSRATLRSLGLADIVALQCAGGRSVILDVAGTGGNSGIVHISRGQIAHAETDEQTGIDALAEMFNWSSPRIRETDKRISKSRTIQGPWATAFLEAWRQARPEEKTTDEQAPPKTGKKIVVVDDTEMLLIFVEDALSTADSQLQITTAPSGADGIRQIESIMPDLVLLDYSLPDFNGDEVCRRLIQNRKAAHIPILMMSGHVAQMKTTAARFKNIVATIEKPFLSDALVDLVQRTLAAEPRPAVVERPPISPPEPAPVVASPTLRKEGPSQAAIEVEQEEAPTIRAPQPPPLPTRPLRDLPRTVATSSAVPSLEKNEVVLGLFLEVMSMQLTPQLRMGAIRARPASSTVSLHFLSAAAQNAIPTEIGFQLGTTELDGNGRISVLRLVPTAQPFQPAKIQNAFEIGGVALVPGENRTRVQLTPAGTTPMTMELFANLEMGGVELSSTFQVAQLILKWPTNVVRITLNPKAQQQNGAAFEAASVKLDNSGRIAEMFLSSIK
ncbi:MAG: response regulator [Verrucomicrobiota bacterium]